MSELIIMTQNELDEMLRAARRSAVVADKRSEFVRYGMYPRDARTGRRSHRDMGVRY